MVDGRTAASQGILLRPLLALAREKKTWMPSLLAGVLWRASTNLGTLHKVLGLLKLPQFAETVQVNPRFPFKYLTRDYLVRNFTVNERLTCFLHHHRRMYCALPDRALRQTLKGRVTLHEINAGSNRFIINMGLPRPPWDKEGELSLNFEVNGELVYNLSFNIIPGWVVESKTAEVILITRVQGRKGCYDKIKLVANAMHEAAPIELLLSAAQGIANVLGIHEIAAVCGTNQNCFQDEYASQFMKAYDEFFTELGLVKTDAGLLFGPISHLCSLPNEKDSATTVKSRRGLRAMKRRATRLKIQLSCAGIFSNGAGQTAMPSDAPQRAQGPIGVGSRSSTLPCPIHN